MSKGRDAQGAQPWDSREDDVLLLGYDVKVEKISYEYLKCMRSEDPSKFQP